MVQHLAFFDAAAIGAEEPRRFVEYVDHLHEHFTDPVTVEAGRYRAPSRPGASAEMYEQSIADHLFPHGPVWQDSADHAAPATMSV